MTKPLNYSSIPALTGGPSFSLHNRLIRLLWSMVWLILARWTPVKFHFWRVFLVKSFGGNVAWNAHIYPSVSIWYPGNLIMEENTCLGPRVNCYCMDRIALRQGAIVSQGVTLCAGSHDIDDPSFQLFTRPIQIEEKAWIAAEAFVGPGVSIGRHAVVGARAVIFKNVVSKDVVVGNPAKVVRKRKVKEQS